ncbi:MAG: ATP-binding cassette domain-containing protein, partial [Pseudomonadota bacterium]
KDLQRFRNQTIGMVFQNFALMPHRSVLDNVAMPLEIRQVAKNERMRQAAAILDIVELGAWGSKFAHELSGGMQQRVGLARALAANPDVLLMDEPFSALDPLIRRQLQDEFIRLQKMLKKTIVFITHDFEEATKLADRIGIMKDGRMVQLSTPEEMVLHPADDYVAEFARNAPRDRIVSVGAVMEKPNGKSRATTNAISIKSKIGEVAEQVLTSSRPVPVVDTDGKLAGQLSRERITKALFGSEEL